MGKQRVTSKKTDGTVAKTFSKRRSVDWDRTKPGSLSALLKGKGLWNVDRSKALRCRIVVRTSPSGRAPCVKSVSLHRSRPPSSLCLQPGGRIEFSERMPPSRVYFDKAHHDREVRKLRNELGGDVIPPQDPEDMFFDGTYDPLLLVRPVVVTAVRCDEGNKYGVHVLSVSNSMKNACRTADAYIAELSEDGEPLVGDFTYEKTSTTFREEPDCCTTMMKRDFSRGERKQRADVVLYFHRMDNKEIM